jgi:hypothetical protein
MVGTQAFPACNSDNGKLFNMFQTLSGWLSEPWVAWSLGFFSAVLASVLLVPRFLAQLPSDYLHDGPPREHHSFALRILRMVLGAVLVLLGVAMLVLPGQGVLTLLVGVMLIDLPGQHALVVRLLRRPKVLTLVNKLRTRHGAWPLMP